MAESLDIGTVINKKMIAASHIYQMMLDADVSNVKMPHLCQCRCSGIYRQGRFKDNQNIR